VVMAVWRATERDPSTLADRSVRMVDVPARRWARLLSAVALVPFIAGQFSIGTDVFWRGAIIVGRVLILAAAAVCWLLWIEHLLVRGWSRPRRKVANPGPGGREALLRRKLRRAPIACAAIFALPGLIILGDSVIKRGWQGVTDNVAEAAIWLALGCLCAILVCGWAGASTVRRELREAIRSQRHLTDE
ncbi:MAG: hypothetical protein L6Q35_01650, partial [Phycisphaerales bacterium]|nr:hypothetical protein [Phycisphaerales bacterium]